MNVEDRIIGDFLGINAEMINQRETSKLPKFVSNIRYKIYQRKLLKNVDKLRKSNYILNMHNLAEFFSYTFNNFPPYGDFKSVQNSKINNEEGTELEAILKTESYSAVITINKKLDVFEISIYNKKSDTDSERISISLNKLHTDNENIYEIINRINVNLLNDICDYLYETISYY